MKRKPNFVFVLTDDQGYPPLGCHGHPFIRTPNLDNFSKQSVRMDQFHVGPTCAPTRAGLLTGHYANSTGVWHTIGGRSLLRKNEWTLADAMKVNGYRTGLFGKWHLGDESPYLPNERGFESTVCHGGGGIGQTPDYWGNDYFDDTYFVNGEPKKFKGYCTDVFFNEALNFIEDKKNEPFFCYIATNAPHWPFNVPGKYHDIYKNMTSSENYARFLGMITNIDENFGRLISKLKELEIYDDTILVFMSDNGQCGHAVEGVDNVFNSGMRDFKGSEYEGGHRAPFFLSYPNGGVRQEHTVTELTAFIDFMPTILDLCGIEIPKGRSFHGKSIKPLLCGERGSEWGKRCIVTDSQRLAYPVKWKQSCVMKGSFRLINRDELYDVSADPAQEKDISPRFPAIVEELRNAYEEWWAIVSRQFDEEIPISIGAVLRGSILTSSDLRNGDTATAWHQGHVRDGVVSNGYWEVLVEKEGRYLFELRRWPEETGHKIRAGIDGDDIEFNRGDISSNCYNLYTGGKSLDIRMACLKIGKLPMLSCPVADNHSKIEFAVELSPGPIHVQAWFTDNRGLFLSPYYVYVRNVQI